MDNLIFENTQLSYNEVNLAMTSLDLSYLESSISRNSRSKQLMLPNSLVLAMKDEKAFPRFPYYPKLDYQKNRIGFIDNEHNVYPLTYCLDEQNHLYIDDNYMVKLRVDGNTIQVKDSTVSVPLDKVRKVGYDNGTFIVDDSSLMMKDSRITLGSRYSGILDLVSSETNKLESTSKKLYRQLLSFSATDQLENFPLHRERNREMDLSKDILFIDCHSAKTIKKHKDSSPDIAVYYNVLSKDTTWFKLVIDMQFEYVTTSIKDFNPVDLGEIEAIYGENNKYPSMFSFSVEKSYMMNKKINRFIYDEEKLCYHVEGTCNYIAHFDVNDVRFSSDDIDAGYTIDEQIVSLMFKKSASSLGGRGILMKIYKEIGTSDKNSLHDVLYYDMYEGYNYDGIGDKIGLCIIPTNFYTSQQLTSKPIFAFLRKRFATEANKATIDSSFDGIASTPKVIYDDGGKGDFSYDLAINVVEYGEPAKVENREFGYSDTHFIKYRTSHINGISEQPNGVTAIYNHVSYNDTKFDGFGYKKLENDYDTINKVVNAKTLQANGNNPLFSNIYEYDYYGFSRGDLYVPSVNELVIATSLSSIDILVNGSNYLGLRSIEFISGYYASSSDSESYLYGIDPQSSVVTRKAFGSTKEQVSTIAFFRIPDFSVLPGDSYYYMYSNEDNCYIVDYQYQTRVSSIKIKVKANYDMQLDNVYVVSDTGATMRKFVYQNDMMTLTLYMNNLKRNNHITVGYVDSDSSFNSTLINDGNNDVNCRVLCKIHVKIRGI